MSTFSGDGQFLTITEKGYGKRTAVEEYRKQGRGGFGILNIRVSPKNGEVINTCHVQDESSVMLITAQGKLIQLHAEKIRNTQTRAAIGVKCIELDEGDYVASVISISGNGAENGEPGITPGETA
jgi:DNA gyrase subunit A